MENVSPALTSDTFPMVNSAIVSKASLYSMPSTVTSVPNNISSIVPGSSVVLQSHVPTASFVNPVMPQNSFLSGTYSGSNYGIISQGKGAESIIPASTNSSFLPPTPQLDSLYPVPQNTIPTVQNPVSFGQTFSNLPPPPLPPPHQPPLQLPPHQLYPTHHQLPPQQNAPHLPLLPHMMSNQIPPLPGGNNPNWNTIYNRPLPNNQPMGGGGWLR